MDAATFLRALARAFPEATDAYFEGSSVAADVLRVFRDHAGAGPYLPARQTIWSTGTITRSRCRFTAELFEALAAASAHHAATELFDHVFVYADDRPLLEWPDAFANCMWIAPSVDEPRVRALARACGLGHRRLDPG